MPGADGPYGRLMAERVSPLRSRLRLLVGGHLLVSGAVEAVFAAYFGHSPRVIVTHIILIAHWDLALVFLMKIVASFVGSARWPTVVFRLLFALTCTLQLYLYALSAVSNAAWGRNITGHLVVAFAPTVWSGKEPFPLGPPGITVFTLGTLLVMTTVIARVAGAIEVTRRTPLYRLRLAATTAALMTLFGVTIAWGVASRDDLLWKHELITSFFRPEGYAFEPSARREAVAQRDAVLRASYPRSVAQARPKNVILIMVDSLRADRMQIYGYPRETTPFLSGLVQSGQMKKVEAAFSSCSESFCGITSTLASRDFRNISVRTFQLQDVLRDQGYRTWFLLSGNHSAWNGLPFFYRAGDDTFFDGSMTQRYTMDDDRLILEGLERVPEASPDQPAFFYVHLMSPHYLGVQFEESHVFTRPDDRVSPGVEPYKILSQLNKPDRYDDKVRQADGIIRDLFAALRAKRYLDDAIVVVTGDHGEGLGERHWAHGWHLYNEDIRVPMLFYDAPAESYPDLTFAAHVDIAPTILDRLGLPIPESWEGQSLLAPSRTRFTFHQTYFVPNRFGVLYRNDRALFKFIATPQYGTEELYDLTTDHREVRNLIVAEPALAAVLREKVREYRDEGP
jgi:glucan phosphoethanolaminetransferase (alkaline phosphatase superfamily)